MNIDGHAVRLASIDAVTEIEVKIDGAYEGTDKIVRGKFELYIRGLKLVIGRGQRCHNTKSAQDAAEKNVRTTLEAIRDVAKKAISIHEV